MHTPLYCLLGCASNAWAALWLVVVMGTVTHWFGVRYGIDTPAFYEHSLQAIIPAGAIHSLPVHAVQLYESIGCLIAVARPFVVQKKIKISW